MSRAWMPFYWGDYLKDTRDLTTLQHGAYMLLIGHYWQHEGLPTDERQLSAIAGLSLSKWRAIEPPIRAKFLPEWKHKRIDDELERMERKINQRIIAGQRGGQRSGVARAIKSGQRIKEAETKQPLQSRLSPAEAETKQSRTNHQVNITSSEPSTAREVPPEEAKPKGLQASPVLLRSLQEKRWIA